METIWGCDTVHMDEIAEQVAEKAEQLIELFRLLRGASDTVEWIGPDAEAHRARTHTVTTAGTDLCGILRDLSRRLEEESTQQTTASQVDSDTNPLVAVRADITDLLPAPLRDKVAGANPFAGGGSGDKPAPTSRWGLPLSPEFSPFPELDPGFRDPDATWGVPTVPGVTPFPEIDPGFRAPLGDPIGFPGITGPLGMPALGEPFARQEPYSRPELPDGEEYDLSPRALENGETVRQEALSYVPGASQAQHLMGLHEQKGNFLDGAEQVLEDHGYDALLPAVDLARVGQSGTSLLIGENSTIGQAAEGLDMMVANAGQTTVEVSDAVGNGDLEGAIRAGERGVYRNYEGLATVATASPMWKIPEVGGDMAGSAADAIEPFSPAAAEPLRSLESTSHDIGDHVNGFKDAMLDSENWYDARRRALPLPWDPK
ncbi:hypothetical protein [Brachybacterium tyrofermentans]|uniref:WXG100 family type VII secretion target n=1 Tax=Brachybacterium tyrofermentans TaxID=47848 RepID=A0ABW0FG68_9MICO|nr:hypothetical protein [Brachybacterium tyrofermentans]